MTTPTLQHPKDWELWYSMIARTAESYGVFRYLDISKEQIPAPEVPERPYPGNLDPEVDSVAGLSQTYLAMYNTMQEDYKFDYTEYDRVQKGLRQVATIVNTTVAVSLQRQYNEIRDLYTILWTLKNKVAPSNEAREHELATEYQALKTVQNGMNPLDWITAWEILCKEAKQHGLPEVSGDRPVNDFLNAVLGVDKEWATAQIVSIQNKKEKGKFLPGLEEITERFRSYLRIHRPTETFSIHTAFANETGTLRKQNPTQTASETKTTTEKGGKKGQWICQCGENHKMWQCKYLNPTIRPKGWKPDENIVNKFKDHEQNNEGFRKALERQRKRNFKAPGKPTAKEQADTDAQLLLGPSEDKSEQQAHVYASCFASSSKEEGLSNVWILDSGANTHICNDPSKFEFERTAHATDMLESGKDLYPIEAWGHVVHKVHAGKEIKTITLANVGLVRGFFTNTISNRKFNNKGVYWDQAKSHLANQQEIISDVVDYGDHYVLKIAQTQTSKHTVAANSGDRRPITADASKWHQILGHAGRPAIDHLAANVDGAIVNGSINQQPNCETCSLSKAKAVISRRTGVEMPAEAPMARCGFDLIPMTPALTGQQWISHFVCTFTGMEFCYTHKSKGMATAVVEQFVNMAKKSFERPVKYLRTDGEKALGAQFDKLMAHNGIKREPSAPATPQQNGAVERSGGVIITRARCLRISANLPSNLWPEIVLAASYLNNRTPKKGLDWKTPFEKLFGTKPDLSHLHVYGCRAYPLKKDIPHLDKLEARAHIGYLVGYDSRNIFRI
jgi:hypothetical protein